MGGGLDQILALAKLGVAGYGLYATYDADSDTDGGNATLTCYASNGIGTLLSLMKFMGGSNGGMMGGGGMGGGGMGGKQGPGGDGGQQKPPPRLVKDEYYNYY